jgi:hypothetical protein
MAAKKKVKQLDGYTIVEIVEVAPSDKRANRWNQGIKLKPAKHWKDMEQRDIEDENKRAKILLRQCDALLKKAKTLLKDGKKVEGNALLNKHRIMSNGAMVQAFVNLKRAMRAMDKPAA